MKRSVLWVLLMLVALAAAALIGCAASNGDDDDSGTGTDDDDNGDDADDDDSGDDDSGDDDSGDDDSGDDDSGDDDDSGATIYDVQQGEYNEGDVVTVTGVVTTPLDYQGDGFFIQDPDGGEYSGIFVYMYSEVAAEYDGEMGDVVTVTGEVTEFYEMTELTVKEVGGVEITGSTDVPAPATIDLGEELEPWESVLVTVEDVEVTSAPDDYGEFIVENGDGSVSVDDLFFEKDHWATYGVESGDQFSSITGALNYSYDAWKIEPRSDSDLTE